MYKIIMCTLLVSDLFYYMLTLVLIYKMTGRRTFGEAGVTLMEVQQWGFVLI